MTAPVFDPRVEYMPVSKLRNLNKRSIRELDHALAVTAPSGTEPLAVIVPFQLYMILQDALVGALGKLKEGAGSPL